MTDGDNTATYVGHPAVPRPLGACITAPDVAYRLSKGSCVIGSAPDCEVSLTEPTVSRRHAELRLVPEGIFVKDLGSHNGTYFSGQRVERMVLPLGGQIQVGRVVVTIDVDRESLSQGLGVHPEPVYRGIVGRSGAMRSLFAMLQRLEGSLVNMLVEGESGVGKELIARALHDGSTVADGPYVAINCGAVSPELVASELFGHARGAFTGADGERLGAFASADGGTLFLDEIGELPLSVQPLLLRVLETREVRRVGSDDNHNVRVRVVAATNRDLEAEVRDGRFREDLYYRLAVVKLVVPPLRARVEDVEALALHFARGLGMGPVAPEVLAELRSRAWPGNARELRNVMEAYAALGILPQTAQPEALALEAAMSAVIDVTQPYPAQKEQLIDRFTRLYLEELLRHTGGNHTEAAAMAGLGRTYMSRLLKRYGLAKRDRRR